jgi:CHAT domain-containing protein/tetratricopeptide (TPR) repeat protein
MRNTVVLGDYRKGLQCYDEAAEIYRQNGLLKLQAQTQIARIFALATLGGYKQALADGEWALGVLREHEEWFHAARLLSNMAAIHGRLSQHPQALALFDQASETYQKLGIEGQPHWLRLQINRANVLRYLGRFEESMEASRNAVKLHLERGEIVPAARARQTLANTLYVLGRYNEALALLDEVRDVLRDDGRLRQSVLVDLFTSDCLLQLRRFDQVIEKCRQVRALFTELGTNFEVGQAIMNEARAYAGLGHYPEALVSLDEARQIFESEGNRAAVAEADLQTALVHLSQGLPEKCLPLADACQNVFEEEGMPIWQAQASLVAARGALALGDLTGAEARVRQALAAGEQHQLLALTYPCYHMLGQLASQRSEYPLALESFSRSIQELEQLCGRLMVEYRAAFVEDKGSVYEDAVALCLQQGRPLQGLEFAERAKSRALLDLLSHRLDLSIRARSDGDQPIVAKLSRLRQERDQLYRHLDGEGLGQRGDTTGFDQERQPSEQRVLNLEKQITELWHRLLVRNADYARDAALWQVRTEPVQPYLDPDTVLLEYFTVEGRPVVFRVTRSDVQAFMLSVQMAEVQRLLQLLWLNLRAVPRSASGRGGALLGNARSILKRLYENLIAPVIPEDEHLRQLVIVPHGALHYLPFQALYDGQVHLIERWQVSYLPGASFLRYCSEFVPSGQGVIAFGHSNQGRLPNTNEEAAAIADLWQGQALLEEEATLAQFRELAPQSRLIHLAAHGDFRPDNPLFSGLVLEDGWMTTLDVFNLRLGASLVTLSACQTGRSVVSGGDELLGLMRSFLAAGAASLVATHWAVEDRSISMLMRSFNQKMVEGQNKGAALRQAQLELMHSEDAPVYEHPYYWAPVFLVGNAGML